MRIRALTYHLNPRHANTFNELDYFKEKVKELKAAKELLEEKSGLEVWSIRFSVPLGYSPSEEAVEFLSSIEEIKTVIYARESGEFSIIEANRYLNRNFYVAGFLKDSADVEKVKETIVKVSEKPSNSAKLAFEISGKDVITPYFPLSKHPGNKPDFFSLALMYPDDVLKHGGTFDSLKKVLNEAYASLESFVQNGIMGIPLIGVDYSLSPWMDESVALVIEAIGGCKLGKESCLATIYKINFLLENFSSKHYGIGFNEIMLPLAEDKYLMELVSDSVLGLKDFILFSYVCVAGIDMIPLRGDINKLYSFVEDVVSIAKMKGRPYGIRLIYLPLEYHNKMVHLEGFGDTPVLDL